MRNGIEDQALIAGALLGNALAGYADDVVARLEELVADGFADPSPPESPMTANVPCSVSAIVHQFGDFILNLGRLGHQGI